MIKTVVLSLIVALAFCAQGFLQNNLYSFQKDIPRPGTVSEMPVALSRVISLEYALVVSDIAFVKSLNVFGRILENRRNSSSQIAPMWLWKKILHELEISTFLDGYFLDPYYFSNTIASSHPSVVNEVNTMLVRGAHMRYWDWELPLYIGFNNYFLLNNPQEASRWIMEAAERPGNKSNILGTLAARLAYRGNQTENGIVFLRRMLETAKDPVTIEQYRERLIALEGIWLLEKGVESYKNTFGFKPLRLSQLVEKGIVVEIPVDPYGGVFFLGEDGKVKTTSNFRPINDRRSSVSKSED